MNSVFLKMIIYISSFKIEQIFSQNDNTSVQKEKYFALYLHTVATDKTETRCDQICAFIYSDNLIIIR